MPAGERDAHTVGSCHVGAHLKGQQCMAAGTRLAISGSCSLNMCRHVCFLSYLQHVADGDNRDTVSGCSQRDAVRAGDSNDAAVTRNALYAYNDLRRVAQLNVQC